MATAVWEERPRGSQLVQSLFQDAHSTLSLSQPFSSSTAQKPSEAGAGEWLVGIMGHMQLLMAREPRGALHLT